MTKMHRGKKAAASLMAGILLCQMFVFGVSKTSADAREVAKKMSFEVVGEGIVTVTDTAERTQEITSGSVIEVPKGMCVRVQAESPKETDIAVHVLDKDGNYELEDVSEVQGKCFWRDVTAMELEKKVVVTFGKEDKKIRAVRTGQTRGNYNKPEAGDVFTGNCVITAVDGGNGHTVHSVTIGGFTGILAGVTATGGCADHTAAAPYVGQEYTYRYTVTGVNKVTGEVMGNLYCTSVTGSTDGVTKDSGGRLIGYQRISGSALIYRNYSGYAKLKKGKTQTVLTNGNPQYSLEDACYGIYKDRSATNEAATFTTDKEGNSNTVELEEGTYYVKEKKAPKGYRLDETVYPVTVVSGQTVSVNVKDVPVYSDMELILEKIDQEYKAGKSHGAGSLEGAEFTVCYYAGIYDQATLPKTPDRTWVLKSKKEKDRYESRLNKDYQISGDDFYYAEDGKIPVLPLGTISIEETKAPEGYSLDGAYIESVEGKTEGTYYLTKIIQDGNLAKIQGGNTYKIADRIFRGDIEFQKKDEETQESMAGIPFRITSVTTGESHMIMTDANGYFSSASNYVKHSENTNTGQAESGIWFGLNSGGEMSEVNDDNGAFPYDTYKMEELRCGQNVDKALYKGTFKISRDNYILDLGTIMNPDLVISTVAKDEETGTHYSNADESVTVIDTVTYTGLKKGKEYVMKGTLMDHKTGEPVLDSKGKKIFGLQKFIPKTAKGSVEVEFNFDGNTLAGKNITVFEECYLDEELIAVHKDIEDVSQMIHFPELKTSVKDDQTGIHIIKSEKDMQITDTVEYHNLKKGKKYKITGILMDKDTGKAVKDANGEKITSSVEFVAEDTDGSVDVKFNFDGTNLGGKILVAFEKLYYGEKLYGTHADLEDEEQTMYVPEVETVALNKETETHHALADGTVELLDTVKYRNLLPGRNYTLHGMIVEKETGNPVSEERTLEFVPEKSEGSVELGFEISADELCGKTIVVYEEIKADGKSIAEHKDPEAKEQSIYFPEIGTKALDENSKTQEGEAKEKQKIIDQITYKNLLPDETYVLKGVLMDKETGKELLDENGKRVTAGISFVPENEEGTIEMTFELDARMLSGKSVVVFERLYDEEEHLIAKEEDIENADQTILYRKQEIPKNTIVEKPGHNSKEVRKSPKTGDENRMDLWLVMLCAFGIAVVTEIVIYKRRNR